MLVYVFVLTNDLDGFVFFVCLLIIALAGRVTTHKELDDMFESGNSSMFTSAVSPQRSPAAAAAAAI